MHDDENGWKSRPNGIRRGKSPCRSCGTDFFPAVFNDSVWLFLKKKAELADYFDESATEDIFEYIPPQKTNQQGPVDRHFGK